MWRDFWRDVRTYGWPALRLVLAAFGAYLLIVLWYSRLVLHTRW